MQKARMWSNADERRRLEARVDMLTELEVAVARLEPASASMLASIREMLDDARAELARLPDDPGGAPV